MADEIPEAAALADFYFRCGCGCDREGYTVDVVPHLTAAKDAEITQLREQVARLTKLHDKRDAIERAQFATNLTVMADALDNLADEMAEKQRAMREEDNRTIRSSGLGEGVRMARARAAALRVSSPSAPAQEGQTT